MSNEKKERGSFIVLEGLDRTGKSTQCRLLEQKIKQLGHQSVQIMRFPERTTAIGKMIDSYLRQDSELDDHVIHLLFSANRWEKSKQIISTLESGTTIISDRYAFSGTAFTAAKLQIKDPSEAQSLVALTSPDQGLPLPDLVIFLTLDDESASRREGFGMERYENQTLQKEVARQFNQVVYPFFTSLHGLDRWVIIDASGSIQDVETLIWQTVEQYFQKSFSLNLPIGKLWVA